MTAPLDLGTLTALLGGEQHLRDFYEIGPRDTRIEIIACIEAACEIKGIAIGREDGKPWTLSVTVADLADRLASIGDQRPAPRARPTIIPTIDAIAALSAYLRGCAA